MDFSVLAQKNAASKRASVSSGIAKIEAYCAQLDQYVKSNPKAGRIFADVASGMSNQSSKWREFSSEDEREQADDGDNLNQNAIVWLKDDVIAIASCTFQSPSRDWAHYVGYYFRNDGTLAKTDSTLITFYGHVKVVRSSLYDKKGQVLKSSVQYLSLDGKKVKKPDAKDEEFVDEPIPLYHRSQDLPFYNLLKKTTAKTKQE
jgi:hypothetical protein